MGKDFGLTMRLLIFFLFLYSWIMGAMAEGIKNPCEEGWIQATWVDMGCLLFDSGTTLTWEAACYHCQTKDAALVEITTEEQLEFLKMELTALDDHITNSNWWTAGTDIGREGKWIWIESLAPVTDFVWRSG